MPLDASSLSLADLDTSADEPRVSHVRLAAVLGYDQPIRLADLIKRNIDELRRYGEVSRTVRETSAKGGRPGKEYWLTEGQALLATIRSDAPNAPDAREQIIRVFMAWRRGKLTLREDNTLPSASLIDDLARKARRIRDLEEQLARTRGTTRPPGLDIATLAARDSRIANLEAREEKLLAIVYRLAGSQ